MREDIEERNLYRHALTKALAETALCILFICVCVTFALSISSVPPAYAELNHTLAAGQTDFDSDEEKGLLARGVSDEDRAKLMAMHEEELAKRAEENTVDVDIVDSFRSVGLDPLADYVTTARDYAFHEHFNLSCASYGTSQALVDAGGIVEYWEAWYASHNFDEGAIFYQFDPGDVVHIDDRVVDIEGVIPANYYNDTYWSVRDNVGYDVVIFQTCVDDREPGAVLIYYGHDRNSAGPYGM